MTQKKISELNAATTLAGTEVLPVVQSAATVKATVNQVLANLSATNLTSGTVPLARLSGITDTEISASAAIAWSKIDKTGSSVDDIADFPAQTSNADKALVTDGTDVSWGYPEGVFAIACSDETTDITTGDAKVTFRAPFAFTIHKIPRASLSTASSSGLPEVDIRNGADSIFSTKLTIDANETTSTTATTAAVLDTDHTAVSDDAEIKIDIDTAGTGAKGLKVYLYYRRT
jgi:hypothetical protein